MSFASPASTGNHISIRGRRCLHQTLSGCQNVNNLSIPSSSRSLPLNSRLHLLPKQQKHLITSDLWRYKSGTISCACIPPETDPSPSTPDNPSESPFDYGKRLLVGTILSIFVFLFKSKWSPIYRILNQVKMAIAMVEGVVRIVGGAAKGVQTLAGGIANILPEGSILKKAAIAVKHAAAEVDKDAEIVENTIDQVQEMEEKAESFIEEARHHRHRSTKDINP